MVDDHAMFRDAIAEKLGKEPDMAVVGSCGSAAEALQAIRAGAQPAVILLDFDLGPGRVIDFLNEARTEGFSGQVLVVTAGVSGREAVELIQAGVHGILHKHNTQETLCAVIRQVAAGEVFLEKSYLGSVFHDLDQTRLSDEPHLTDRDKSGASPAVPGVGQQGDRVTPAGIGGGGEIGHQPVVSEAGSADAGTTGEDRAGAVQRSAIAGYS